jgi:hypothetical protein
MNGRPTAAAAGKIDVGGDVSVNPGHVEQSVAAASVELVAGEAGDPPGRMPPGVNELMTSAETVNGIVRFQANDLPVVSLYCRVDPGESQREVRARVHSLLDQIRPLARDRDVKQVMVDATPLARPMLAVLGEYCRACVLVLDRESAQVWEAYQDEMREVETVTDPLHKAADTGTSAQDRMDEQTKRHFRRVAGVIDQLLRTDGYDVLVAGGHEHELPEGSCV